MESSLKPDCIRVVLVDDHPIVREGLRTMLQAQDKMAVVAALSGGAQAISYLERNRADVALVDLRMPGIPGIDVIQALRRAAPAVKVIVLSSFELDEEIYQAVQAGACGYLMKDMDLCTIVRGIREVAAGGMYFPTRIARRLSERQMRVSLSPREREILELVAKGFTNKEIAAALRLSAFTVRNHINHLTSKLDVSDRTEAAFFAIQTGLIIVSE